MRKKPIEPILPREDMKKIGRQLDGYFPLLSNATMPPDLQIKFQAAQAVLESREHG